MYQRPEHLMVASSGALYDTRGDNWPHKPLRETYSMPVREIDTTVQFKACLRNGPHVWPGGYPLCFETNDGGTLCFACARKELRHILRAIASNQSDGWRVIGCDVNWEDNELRCDDCGELIESAYGETRP
jgi:hypothetical protein